MKFRYLLTTVLILGLIVSATFLSGALWYYVDIPSLLLIALPPMIIALFIFGPKSVSDAYRAIHDQGYDELNLQMAKTYFDAIQRYIWLSAFLGFCLGVIGMLSNVGSAEALARGFGTLMITVFYGVCAQMAFTGPYAAGVRKRLSERA